MEGSFRGKFHYAIFSVWNLTSQKCLFCLLPLLISNKRMLPEVGGLCFWRLVWFAGRGAQVNWASKQLFPSRFVRINKSRSPKQAPTFSWLGGAAVSSGSRQSWLRETLLGGDGKLLTSVIPGCLWLFPYAFVAINPPSPSLSAGGL